MTAIRGTNVIAPIVPFATDDEYPSHEAAYGRGGYRTVATTAQRDAIPALRREAGMLVCVTDGGKIWKLGTDLSTWTEFSASSNWADITGKPATFPPLAHTHTSASITDFAAAVAAVATGSGSATTDASLLTSGTLDIARLPASVVLASDSRLSDARTPLAHQQAISTITGLQTALDGKQAAGSYAAAVHTHTASDVSGLAAVATSGSYADLANKPTIPAAVTSLPASSITGLATVATTGSYNDLSNKPTIPAAVTSLPAASITGLATVATSGAYADLSGRPSLFSGSYADLTSTPTSFAPSAHNQAWSTITSTPTTLSGYGITDAVGSSDSRLTDSRTPTSHTHGNITNAGAIGSTSGQIVVTTTSGVLTTSATIAASAVTGLATVATSGSYADLSNKPTIPAATTSASDLTSGSLSQARLDFIPIHPFLLMGG